MMAAGPISVLCHCSVIGPDVSIKLFIKCMDVVFLTVRGNPCNVPDIALIRREVNCHQGHILSPWTPLIKLALSC